MHNRYITDQKEIDAIIKKCQVCYVSMVDSDNKPYVVPFNFGYVDGVIYLHSSPKGLKIDILKQKPSVCIVFSTDHELRYQSEQVACSWSMKYKSVQAFGEVEFIEDIEEKGAILHKVMKNYTEKDFTFSAPALREVCTYIVKVQRFSARVYGY